jgi:hypothetical protein
MRHILIGICVTAILLTACASEVERRIAAREDCQEQHGGIVYYSMIIDEFSITVDDYVKVKETQADACQEFVNPDAKARTDLTWMHWFSGVQWDGLLRSRLLSETQIQQAANAGHIETELMERFERCGNLNPEECSEMLIGRNDYYDSKYSRERDY